MYAKYFKRLFDIVFASLALIFLSVIMLLIAALVKLKLGSPVIFKQPRPGKNEKIFMMYKFKSMTDERDENGELLPDEIRLNKFGLKLRSTSLDELPELINIIKGDMSIVGPRPLLVEYLEHYDEFQRRRHEARPGLTGLAQINGRNATTWHDRFMFDVNYIENIGFLMDIKIIFSTISLVFKRKGINSENSVTGERFVKGKEYEKV